ncbi:MAG: hypothetical protein APF84_11190 [Gracilibacter sp. BRH_c7a]|nr:MAG: hypothetical protein APF84_11190 [Gracilibacter sp. BRH_c7a]
MLINLAANIKGKIYWASRLLNVIGTVVVMSMMLLITVDVILRNTINRPIQGSFEIVEFMMAVLVFCFFANGQREKGNVNVEMFVRRLSVKARRILNIFNYFLATGFFILVTIQMFRETYSIYSRYDVSPSLHIPEYPFMLAASVGVLFLSLVLLVDLFVAIFDAKPKENM